MKSRLDHQRRLVGVVCRLSRAVGIAWLATGCRQVLGVSGYHVGDRKDASAEPVASKDASRGGVYDEVTFKDGACGSCMASACKPAVAACKEEPACDQYLSYAAANCAPGDLDCESLAMGIYGLTLRGPEAWDLINCRATACAPECGLPCNGACLGNLWCDQCLASSCADEGARLAASGAAMTAVGCANGAGTLFPSAPANAARCLPTEDGGTDAFNAWNSCRTSRCSGACVNASNRSDWRCLGKISHPTARSGLGEISTSLFVEDIVAFGPLARATVRACANAGNCEPPGTTSDQGLLTLSADLSNGTGTSFYDYLDIQKSGTIPPTLYYGYPPLTQTSVDSIALASNLALSQALVTEGRLTADPNAGSVLIYVASCGLAIVAKGVSLVSDLGGVPFYIGNGDAIDPNLQETGTAGIGGFLNVTPTGGAGDAGTLGTFSGYTKVSDGGPPKLVFTVHALIRRRAVTWIAVPPSPPGGW